ncbi:DUF5060 domain-containing protein [Lutimonas sp.]|uniref:DUF5060 domain-containing protein n=1 Tax=Lutimonas sp. TaxID=1872403 RepID=UPI003D9BC0BC
MNYFIKLSLFSVLLSLIQCEPIATKNKLGEFKQWEAIQIDFEGPQLSETNPDNPFLNYRLEVVFKHPDTSYTVRGFYAADGNAAETSADSGRVWQARFSADRPGEWTYKATLKKGEKSAIGAEGSTTEVEISNSLGDFTIVSDSASTSCFYKNGRISVNSGYFFFHDTKKYWLKMGANSPENLLAFEDFDGTFRMQEEKREGEAEANDKIHSYKNHIKDWDINDPVWQGSKGKGLLGALNYLNDKGMNAVYFLTLNIMGDGKDVWPYRDPSDFRRFDVSKLAQWEIIFNHMQRKGIMLHIVLQETENELMLDGGDTGPQRQLYLNELIARFGHHPGLIWNLGEENGPASFTPEAQNDNQRKAMISHIKNNDPYKHPVLLHTHSHEPARGDVLSQILGFKELDGLSLQVDKREEAARVVEIWKETSEKQGHSWLITMDEIGMWHTAALTDSLEPGHGTLRGDVLWGTLLSGAAGLEWYFGAKFPHNDLSSEDWRQRNQLWEITNHAKRFFTEQLPYWEMQPDHQLVGGSPSFCFKKSGEVYALYFPKNDGYNIDLSDDTNVYSIHWFDPLAGGALQQGSLTAITGGQVLSLGTPPEKKIKTRKNDWVALLRKK